MLVGAESVRYAGWDVGCVAFAQLDRLPADCENAVAF